MATKKIDYDKILNLIKNHLLEVMDDEDTASMFKGYNIVITAEQQFQMRKRTDPNTIYIVVKFGSATTYFGQTVLPATITAMAEANHCNICRTLFDEFVMQYNLNEDTSNGDIHEIYNTPSVLFNFNEVNTDFRSLVSMSAAFVIANNLNFFEFRYYYTDAEGETQFEKGFALSQQIDFRNAIDSQAYFGSHNIAETIAKVGSMTISMAMYFLGANSQLVSKCIDILALANVDSETTTTTNTIDYPFKIGIYFKNSNREIIANYKLVSFQAAQQVGQIPTLNLSFAR